LVEVTQISSKKKINIYIYIYIYICIKFRTSQNVYPPVLSSEHISSVGVCYVFPPNRGPVIALVLLKMYVMMAGYVN